MLSSPSFCSGFTKSVKTQEELDAEAIAAAMDKGVETAYKAVMKPKEGTILTVAKGAAAKAAELADTAEDLDTVFPGSVIEHAEEDYWHRLRRCFLC